MTVRSTLLNKITNLVTSLLVRTRFLHVFGILCAFRTCAYNTSILGISFRGLRFHVTDDLIRFDLWWMMCFMLSLISFCGLIRLKCKVMFTFASTAACTAVWYLVYMCTKCVHIYLTYIYPVFCASVMLTAASDWFRFGHVLFIIWSELVWSIFVNPVMWPWTNDFDQWCMW